MRSILNATGLVLASLVTAVMLALLGIAVALAIGPIPLTALQPTLRSIIARGVPDMRVGFDAPALRWNPGVRELELAVRDLDIRTRDGKSLLHVAQAAIAPDLAAYLRTGRLVIERLVLDQPTVEVTRRADGGLGLRVLDQQLTQAGPGSGDPWAALADFLGRVLTPPAADDPLAGIEILRVQDARLLLLDEALQKRIELGGGTLEFRRRPGPGEIDAQIGIGADGRAGRLDVEIRRLAGPERYRLYARLRDLVPSSLPMAGDSALLRELGVVMDGSLDATLTADGHPSPAAFSLTSRPTMLSLPGEPPSSVALGPVEIAGSIDPLAEIVHIERASGEIAGSDLAASGQIMLAAGARGARGEATASSVDLAELLSLWPKDLAADARHWVAQNLSAGVVDRAGARIEWLAAEGGRPAKLDLKGTFSATGVSVRYVDVLPPAQVSGTGSFTQDELSIQLTGGTSRGVRVDGGDVRLTGLSGPEPRLAVDLRLASTVPAAFQLALSLPADIRPSLPVAPEDTRGQATARLKLDLPLAGSVTKEQIRYDVTGQVDQLVVLDPLPGLDLNEGTVSVQVVPGLLTASGKGRLSTVPVTLQQLRVDFSGNGPPAATARIDARIDPVSLSILGVQPPPFLGGSADVDMLVDMGGPGPPDVRVVADLRQTRIALPALSIDKRPGQPGRLEADVKMGPGDKVTVPLLTLSMPDIEVRGGLEMAGKDHGLTRVDLDRLDLEGSRLRLALQRQSSGAWAATLAGERLDLRPLLGGDQGSSSGANRGGGTPGSAALPPLSLKVELVELVLPGGSLRALKGSAERSAARWLRGSMEATLAAGHVVRLKITQTASTPTRLALDTDDAGSLLQALTPDNRFAAGGSLSLTADILAEQPVVRMKGQLNIRDVTLRGAPLLARLLTLSSFTGILNTLQGNGIYFNRIRTDFALSGGTLTLTDGKANGSQVGLTAAGVVDLDAGTLSLSGTVVPAYSINKFLGSVPIVGRLLRGENGVGAFAVTYSVRGPAANPSVTVNPLSVLVPGFIRDLFGDLAESATPRQPSRAPTR